jgi:hypothetical protein
MDREDMLAVHAALALPEEYRRVILLRPGEPAVRRDRAGNEPLGERAQKLFVRAIERLQQELKEPP